MSETVILSKEAFKAMPNMRRQPKLEGPSNIALDSAKLWQYSAAELVAILRGAKQLPEGW